MKTLIAVFVALMLISGVSLADGKSKTHLGVKANAMVELAANASGGEVVEFDEVLPDGKRITPFVLPVDMFLIVTDYACGTTASTGVLEMVAANAIIPGDPKSGAGRLICKTDLANPRHSASTLTMVVRAHAFPASLSL